MLAEYTGVLVIVAISLVGIGGLLAIQRRLAPRRELYETSDPAERLEPQRRSIPLRFHSLASLFVVFAVAAFYFHPWGAVFRDLGWFGFGSMLVFAAPLVVGWWYVRMKGGVDW